MLLRLYTDYDYMQRGESRGEWEEVDYDLHCGMCCLHSFLRSNLTLGGHRSPLDRLARHFPVPSVLAHAARPWTGPSTPRDFGVIRSDPFLHSPYV